MYITENLVTSNIEIPDSYKVPEELIIKVQDLMPFIKLKFDGEGESRKLIDVEDNIEKRQAYIARNTVSDSEKLLYVQNEIREQRIKFLKAFDIYKTNVMYGIIEETEEERMEIIEWYQNILNMPDTVSLDNMTYKFPITPTKINKYITKKLKNNIKEIEKQGCEI